VSLRGSSCWLRFIIVFGAASGLRANRCFTNPIEDAVVWSHGCDSSLASAGAYDWLFVGCGKTAAKWWKFCLKLLLLLVFE
jgi:hypothetical protein